MNISLPSKTSHSSIMFKRSKLISFLVFLWCAMSLMYASSLCLPSVKGYWTNWKLLVIIMVWKWRDVLVVSVHFLFCYVPWASGLEVPLQMCLFELGISHTYILCVSPVVELCNSLSQLQRDASMMRDVQYIHPQI